jgi:hypothetical protein
MPFLPLDHPEPFSATLGVMHYPAVDEADPPKARAYAAQLLAAAFKRLLERGGTLPCDVTDILLDAGQPLTDLKERQWGGRATGELFKTFFVRQAARALFRLPAEPHDPWAALASDQECGRHRGHVESGLTASISPCREKAPPQRRGQPIIAIVPCGPISTCRMAGQPWPISIRWCGSSPWTDRWLDLRRLPRKFVPQPQA